MSTVHVAAESAVADLVRQGFSVQPDFIPAATLAGLIAQAQALRADGGFRPAGVGRGDAFQVRPEIRSDHIHWIDPAVASGPVAEWLVIVEDLRLRINEALFIGAFEYEGMLAVYPPGSYYRRHLDRFRDTPHRLVTISAYLNPDWSAQDGGALRLHLPAPDADPADPAASGEHLDVLPTAGTAVIFLSDRVWHEVLPATRERFSLTGWLRCRGD